MVSSKGASYPWESRKPGLPTRKELRPDRRLVGPVGVPVLDAMVNAPVRPDAHRLLHEYFVGVQAEPRVSIALPWRQAGGPVYRVLAACMPIHETALVHARPNSSGMNDDK